MKQRHNLIIRDEIRRKETELRRFAAVDVENAVLKASEDEYGRSAVAWMALALVAHLKIIPHLVAQLSANREAIHQLVDHLEVWHSKLINAARLISVGQTFHGAKLAMGATQEMLSYPIAVEAHKDDWRVPHIFRDVAMAIDEIERGRLPAMFPFTKDQHAWSKEELVYRAWAGRAAQAMIQIEVKDTQAFAKVVNALAWIAKDKELSVLLNGPLSWSQVRSIYRQVEKGPESDPVARFARSIRPPPEARVTLQAEAEWLLAQLTSRDGEAFLLCFD